ncbi:MAG: FKBP-type peptidyl-prolyl cis-trans isomerase, partial [Nitrospinales bacterium]
DNETLKTKEDKLGYSIGLNFSRSVQSLAKEVDLNIPMVLKGFKDGLSEGDVLITEEEFKKVMTAFQLEMRGKQAQLQKEAMEKQKIEMAKLGKKNESKGQEFLAKNAKRKGVKTTSSGLQYEIVKAGTGRSPKPTDQVETHYRGTLINGEEFDSSYKRGQPATFPLNGVIPGWTEALQLMKVGGKWKIVVPSNLAYGPRGTRGMIGPNATLIFEIELLAIK